MAGSSNQPPAKIPVLAMLITTYELSQENGKPVFVATVSHTFLGDTEEELKGIMQAHAKTDQFFAGSLKGNWNGIILKNSEPVIYRAGGVAQ